MSVEISLNGPDEYNAYLEASPIMQAMIYRQAEEITKLKQEVRELTEAYDSLKEALDKVY